VTGLTVSTDGDAAVVMLGRPHRRIIERGRSQQ